MPRAATAQPVGPGRWLPEFDLDRFDASTGRGTGWRDLQLPRDLGQDIGSREWWLGMALVLSLCTVAVVAGTLVPPLPLPARAPLTPAQFNETRADAIAPLALGGHTGRVTAPTNMVEALKEAPERPRIETSVRLGGGESLARALRRAGVGADEAASVAGMIGSVRSATPIDLVLGRRDSRAVPRPLESLAARVAFDMRVEVARDADGALAIKRIPIAVDNTPLRVSGTVGGSLYRAARAAGVPAPVVADYIQNMSYVIDFQRQVGAKDRFDIIVEHRRAATGETETGKLLYAGLTRKAGKTGDEPIALMRWSYGGKSQFFRANGESAKKGLMRTPVDGARLTSGFGMRFHPILNYSRLHQGVDFGAAAGSPVMAAAGGKVTFAGPHGGHGNYIMVTHRPGLATAYAHLSGFAVRNGQQVAQGQVIGYVGSTGLSTGPHLHYEVWLNNQPVNPVAIKFLGGTQLSGPELARFKTTMAQLRNLRLAGGMDAGDTAAFAPAATADVPVATAAALPAKSGPAAKAAHGADKTVKAKAPAKPAKAKPGKAKASKTKAEKAAAKSPAKPAKAKAGKAKAK